MPIAPDGTPLPYPPGQAPPMPEGVPPRPDMPPPPPPQAPPPPPPEEVAAQQQQAEEAQRQSILAMRRPPEKPFKIAVLKRLQKALIDFLVAIDERAEGALDLDNIPIYQALSEWDAKGADLVDEAGNADLMPEALFLALSFLIGVARQVGIPEAGGINPVMVLDSTTADLVAAEIAKMAKDKHYLSLIVEGPNAAPEPEKKGKAKDAKQAAPEKEEGPEDEIPPMPDAEAMPGQQPPAPRGKIPPMPQPM